jgi:hypothetical protein
MHRPARLPRPPRGLLFSAVGSIFLLAGACDLADMGKAEGDDPAVETVATGATGEVADCVYPPGVSKDDYYLSCDSTQQNWGRTFPDQTVTAATLDGRLLSVTTSTALAGAVVSIRLGDHEFIHSGGHGAAVQYAFHDSTRGECFNPTEGGAGSDDPLGNSSPHHQVQSTSYLYSHQRSGSAISASNQMAMWLGDGDPSSWCPDRPGTADYPYSPYWPEGRSKSYLSKTVDVGARVEMLGLPNILTFAADVNVTDTLMSQYDGWLIFYLNGQHTRLYSYDAEARALSVRDPAVGQDSGSLSRMFIACADDRNCFAMFVDPRTRVAPGVPTGGYWYSDSTGGSTIQTTFRATNIGSNGTQRLYLQHMAVVGSLDTVQGLLTNIWQRLGSRPLALSRYFNPASSVWAHWVTTGVAASGFGLDGVLGFLSPTAAGATPLYSCRRGADRFLSTFDGCEGYVTEAFEGFIYTGSGAGRVPLHRCKFGDKHFASTDPLCEGQPPERLLGYLTTSAPLARWFNGGASPSWDHWTTTGIPTTSFRKEIRIGSLGRQQAGTAPLYGCVSTWRGVRQPDHFLSRQPTCEGSSQLGVEGHVFTAAGAGRTPIYRCQIAGNHFVWTDAGCQGHQLDGLLGYVAP